MTSILPDDAAEERPTIDMLNRALRHHERASAAYEECIDRILGGEDVPWSDAEKAARGLQTAMQSVLNLWEKTYDELGRRGASHRDYALDLDEARERVAGLLDRLRAAEEAG